MKVKIYSKHRCPQCNMVKRFLNERDVKFEEVNIEEDPVAVFDLKRMGFQTVPVTIIKENENDEAVLTGFDIENLKKIFGK